MLFRTRWSNFLHGKGELNAESFRNNRATLRIKLIVIAFSLGDIINEWRDTIDLEHVSFSDGPYLAEILRIPFTYCWSPALVPKPADWGSHIGESLIF